MFLAQILFNKPVLSTLSYVNEVHLCNTKQVWITLHIVL